ncbi:MAG TPA: hypothetical protein VEL07_10405 [Planctomycetota bacterium]|nr:hypothetical protein [Planctomycetota bacterium]
MRGALRTLVLGLPLALAGVEPRLPSHWERDGCVVIEMESLGPAPGWVLERDLAGFSGDGFCRDAGGSEVVARFVVLTPGRWRMALRNRHEHPDATLENDCFTSVDGSTPIKTFSSQRGAWTWATRLEDGAGFHEPLYDFDPGVHELRLRGRSAGFRIDRIRFVREGASDASAPESLLLPTLPATLARAAVDGRPGPVLAAAAKLAEDPEAVAAAAAIDERIAGIRATLATLRDAHPDAAADVLAHLAAQCRPVALAKELAAQAAEWAATPAARRAAKARAAVDAIAPIARRLAANGVDARVPATAAAHRQDLTRILATARAIAEALPGSSADVRARTLCAAIGLTFP